MCIHSTGRNGKAFPSVLGIGCASLWFLQKGAHMMPRSKSFSNRSSHSAWPCPEVLVLRLCERVGVVSLVILTPSNFCISPTHWVVWGVSAFNPPLLHITDRADNPRLHNLSSSLIRSLLFFMLSLLLTIDVAEYIMHLFSQDDSYSPWMVKEKFYVTNIRFSCKRLWRGV
jgi:hypothetical protein